MNDTRPLGVVLFQLGGPDSLVSVEPFLFNLFSDPDIIDFPFARLARPALARLISSRRARHVQKHYAEIGGKSPIRELTEQQAAALEAELRRSLDARVFVAMRYWRPLTEEAIRRAQGCRELILLPLYPQYSTTTTRSSLNEWQRQYAKLNGARAPVRIIHHFYDHPLYIEAVVERINEGLQGFGDHAATSVVNGRMPAPTPDPRPLTPDPSADVHLVFSAHGVPMKAIEAGDPYREHIEATVRLVCESGRWPNPHTLCYQSRVGPGRWLAPSLDTTLHKLASEGARRVLVVPIAFVTDHVETLHEIDIEARRLAHRLGIPEFATMSGLNDSPTFIRALADLVRKALEDSPQTP
ncbi:MAG TPA: ferrochelatase [Terriglobia bacterium]|nr:ferrochelatase [Terriglobia bacterium]